MYKGLAACTMAVLACDGKLPGPGGGYPWMDLQQLLLLSPGVRRCQKVSDSVSDNVRECQTMSGNVRQCQASTCSVRWCQKASRQRGKECFRTDSILQVIGVRETTKWLMHQMCCIRPPPPYWCVSVDDMYNLLYINSRCQANWPRQGV